MKRAYIGFGSNLGQKRANIERALMLVHELPATRVVAQSRHYCTDPWAMAPGTPAFLNGCAQIETGLAPEVLLARLHQIERRLGRFTLRGPRGEYLSRPIDLDLLLYEGVVQPEAPTTLPHPEIESRRFVLEPLCELAPALVHPVLGKSIRKLLEECPDHGRVWALDSVGR